MCCAVMWGTCMVGAWRGEGLFFSYRQVNHHPNEASKKKLEFQLVLWANSSLILLAKDHFLLVLVNDVFREWRTWTLVYWKVSKWAFKGILALQQYLLASAGVPNGTFSSLANVTKLWFVVLTQTSSRHSYLLLPNCMIRVRWILTLQILLNALSCSYIHVCNCGQLVVVQKVNNAIHWKNLCLVDNAIGFPLDGNYQRLTIWLYDFQSYFMGRRLNFVRFPLDIF